MRTNVTVPAGCSVALAAVIALAGCGADGTPSEAGSLPSDAITSTGPTGGPCPGGDLLLLADGLKMPVGACFYVDGYTSKRENFRGITIRPATAMTSVNQRTFQAKTPGRVTVIVETFFNDCPSGPCARPNPDKIFRINIT